MKIITASTLLPATAGLISTQVQKNNNNKKNKTLYSTTEYNNPGDGAEKMEKIFPSLLTLEQNVTFT